MPICKDTTKIDEFGKFCFKKYEQNGFQAVKNATNESINDNEKGNPCESPLIHSNGFTPQCNTSLRTQRMLLRSFFTFGLLSSTVSQ